MRRRKKENIEEMGLGVFLKLLDYMFNVIAWPSFTLVFPLYASIQAIESDSCSKNQQCLAYWVLFSLITILELVFSKFLQCLPFWPYAKGLATFLLVIPYFGGASYVYKHFVKPYISVNSQICNILFIPRKKIFILSEENNFFDAVKQDSTDNGLEESEKLIIFQEKSKSIDDTTQSDYTCPASLEKVQKEWSCALCQISTTSEKCLKKHLQGRKHKTKEEELRAIELATKEEELRAIELATNPTLMPSMQKRTNGMLDNLNQIAWVNLEKWSGLLIPVAKSIRWCRWKRPALGWTKLNTDGSIDPENAGFGGLLRDNNGDPICAYVSKASRGDVFLVELWAVWRGLILALNLGIKAIWVESDSLSVVKTINKEQPYSRKAAGSCLKHIWELLNKFEKYKVSHTWREANKAADHLSKLDLSKNDVVLWPVDFPDSLWNIIKDDAQGRRYRRG